MGAMMDLEQIGYFIFMEEQERREVEKEQQGNTADKEEQEA